MEHPAPTAHAALPCGLCEDPSGETARLITGMAQRDTAALDSLHQLWAPVLLGIACRMTGTRQSAEQILLHAFVRMWQRAHRYDPHDVPPFVWAFSILRGCCEDHLRKRRPGPALASDHLIPIQLQAAATIPENPGVMTSDDWQRVRSALTQLPPDERCCLELAVFLQLLRHPQAICMAPSTVAVKSRLRRGIDRLRQQLSRYEL